MIGNNHLFNKLKINHSKIGWVQDYVLEEFCQHVTQLKIALKLQIHLNYIIRQRNRNQILKIKSSNTNRDSLKLR